MKGMISWFAKNSVAANLLMVLIIVSGAISIISINSEVFPNIDLEMISIEVPYLGAFVLLVGVGFHPEVSPQSTPSPRSANHWSF